MALEPTENPLERARRAAQADAPDGWVGLSESIMSRVRALVVPSEPMLTFADDGTTEHDADGSRTWVSARVVTAAVRRALAQPTHAPDDIDLDVVDDRLVGIGIGLVCTYGLDLVALADAAREQVHRAVVELLGADPRFGPGSISVDVVDVVVGDPHVV